MKAKQKRVSREVISQRLELHEHQLEEWTAFHNEESLFLTEHEAKRDALRLKHEAEWARMEAVK